MGEFKKLKKLDKGKTKYKRCIVSNAEFPKEKMIRFVVGPDKEIVVDIEARLPGRGYWLRAKSDIINSACTKKHFTRATRMKVRVPIDLTDRVERLLVQKCQSLIGLARRAGQAVIGLTKIEAWLKLGKPTGVFIAAVDMAEHRRKKIWAWAEGAPIILALRAEELGLAFSRDHVVHVIISPGPLANNLRATALRLGELRC